MPAFLDHFELTVSRLERTRLFFEVVFGWESGSVSDSPLGRYQRLTVGEGEAPRSLRIGLLEGTEDVLGTGSAALPVLRLEDESIEDCLKRVIEAGGEVIAEPRAVAVAGGGEGRFARFADPDGHRWGLWAPGG